MSYNSFVYDQNLIENNLQDQAPDREMQDLVAIHFSRRGLTYKKIYTEDYEFVFYGKTPPVLKELEAPSYFPKSEELAFFRKGIRDGYLYIYCPSDDFWLIYEVRESKKYTLLAGDGSEAAKKAIALIQTNKVKQQNGCVFLPEKDEYFVAYSCFVWTKDYLDKAVKNRNAANSIFVPINIKKWTQAKKDKNPLILAQSYMFREDIYELRDKSISNPYKHIISPLNSPTYDVGKYTDRAEQYSNKQRVLYFTLDDMLGVVEDLNAEINIYMSYQNNFSKAVQKCQAMLDSNHSENSSQEELEALYSSAALLYNMLYANGGALNSMEDKTDESTDRKHKYQSLVQKYKFTKLLAVDERKAIQKKYIVLRDLLGQLIDCDAYKKEINTFRGQSKSIAFMGQSLLMNHLQLLMNKSDSFDADINLNEEKDKEIDKWSEKIKELTMAYLKQPNKDEDVTSALVKLLREEVEPDLVAAEYDKKSYYLPETTLQLEFIQDSFNEMLLGCIKVATTAYLGLAETADCIENLKESINKLLGKNLNIINTRKVKIAEILRKYNLADNSSFLDELSRENQSNINARSNNNGVSAAKIEKQVSEVKKYQRYQLKQNQTAINNLEVQLLELQTKGNMPTWLKKQKLKDFLKKMDQLIGPLNLFFAAKKVAEDAMNEDKNVSESDYLYYSLLLIGNSYDLVKKGDQVVALSKNLSNVSKMTKHMKLAKGFLKGVTSDLILFSAECVKSYQMLSMRNPKAAYYNILSAGLSLMSGVCIAIALSLPIVGLIILAVAALALQVASYYYGERADKSKYNVWQSFLICSIFSNYYEEKYVKKDIVTSITEDNHSTHYDVALELYKRKAKIAINNYCYKNKEYNLQNFTEMLNLLDEMSTCFDVNLDVPKINYSYEATGNYIIPTDISVMMSYFGTTRFDAIDYFLYIDVFPSGNPSGIVVPCGIGINSLDKSEIVTKEGKNILILTFNIWKALHDIKNAICENDEYASELVKRRVLELAKPRSESHIIYPTTMTYTFGCRLVNSKQEKNQAISSADEENQKRIYLPWKDGEKDIYKGFKCRVGIPIPNAMNTMAYFYRNIYGHMVSSVGTFEELQQLELSPISYNTKVESIIKY